MSTTESARSGATAQGGEKRITRSDLLKSWLIWTFFSHSNYNYERLQASAFAHAMTPIIRVRFEPSGSVIEIILFDSGKQKARWVTALCRDS